MKEYQYILFDLDGTLTDPKEGITKSVAYALDYYGFSDEQGIEAVEKYREYFKPYWVYENKVYEGVDNLLKSLKESGKVIILATSKPIVFAKTILDHFDLMKYFDVVCGSELDGRRVKKGDVIAYALEQTALLENKAKVNKSLAVMIGDREHDMIGAKENEIDAIGVLYGYGCIEEFRAHGASKIFGKKLDKFYKKV